MVLVRSLPCQSVVGDGPNDTFREAFSQELSERLLELGLPGLEEASRRLGPPIG